MSTKGRFGSISLRKDRSRLDRMSESKRLSRYLHVWWLFYNICALAKQQVLRRFFSNAPYRSLMFPTLTNISAMDNHIGPAKSGQDAWKAGDAVPFRTQMQRF